MKFGLRYCNTAQYASDTSLATELIQAGEQAGFESAWTIEHTIMPATYDSVYPYNESGKLADGASDLLLPDPLIWMAHMAAVSTTIKLGTAIYYSSTTQPSRRCKTNSYAGLHVWWENSFGHRCRVVTRGIRCHRSSL